MTTPTSVVSADLTALTLAADAAGLSVVSAAAWPETADDVAVTPLAGFIDSTFSPLVAEVGGRALRRRDAAVRSADSAEKSTSSGTHSLSRASNRPLADVSPGGHR